MSSPFTTGLALATSGDCTDCRSDTRHGEPTVLDDWHHSHRYAETLGGAACAAEPDRSEPAGSAGRVARRTERHAGSRAVVDRSAGDERGPAEIAAAVRRPAVGPAGQYARADATRRLPSKTGAGLPCVGGVDRIGAGGVPTGPRRAQLYGYCQRLRAFRSDAIIVCRIGHGCAEGAHPCDPGARRLPRPVAGRLGGFGDPA